MIKLFLESLFASAAVANVLVSLWLVLLIGAILVGFVPGLKVIGQHGKMQNENYGDTINSDPINKLFYLPKKRFVDFYLLGFLVTLICCIATFVYRHELPLGLLLFQFHICRRIYESITITSYGDSKMHVGGYLVGLLHYILAPLSLSVAATEAKSLSAIGYVIVAAFLIANWLQYKYHYILYLLKACNPRYQLPAGNLFDYCTCPHYLMEIVIYCLLTVLCPTPATVSMFTWVTGNLSVVAYNQYSWYLDNCFEDVKRRRVFILFPFLW
jgi:hypothetical protein